MTGAALVFGDISSVLDAIGQFFENLAAVEWIPLIGGLVLYGLALTARSRGSYNVLRAAYPAERFRWLPVWGAYVAAYGANAVFPARPGDIVRLFLLKRTVPNSHYPTLYASFLVENIFDWAVGIVVLLFAFTQGVFPKPPDFSKLDAFDLSYFAAHPQFTLFVLTVLGIVVLIAIAWLSARVKAFWARVRQGWTILRDKRRYLREVVSYQALAWALRFGCFWLLLEAFGIPPSVRNVLLVFGVAAVSSLVPLTPGARACSRPCWSRCSPAAPLRRPSPRTRSASRSRSRRSPSGSAWWRSSWCSKCARSGRSSGWGRPSARPPSRLRS